MAELIFRAERVSERITRIYAFSSECLHYSRLVHFPAVRQRCETFDLSRVASWDLRYSITQLR